LSVSLWRIAVEARAYPANDLAGTGAKITGGRWNSPGVAMLYCASTVSLAVLETVIHLQSGDLPFNRCVVRIDVPDDVWASRLQLTPLPAGWDVIPHGISSCSAGDAWAASLSSALLMVPSVIVPEEFNVLINPMHPDRARITATTIRRWSYDPRFS